MNDRIMMEHVLDCLKDFIIKSSLVVSKSVDKYGFHVWKFDKKLNTRVTGAMENDMRIVTVCCKKTVEMFAHYQAMSDQEYLNEVISRR